jgi:hypothetical protein
MEYHTTPSSTILASKEAIFAWAAFWVKNRPSPASNGIIINRRISIFN